jgi:hypothetical protein
LKIVHATYRTAKPSSTYFSMRESPFPSIQVLKPAMNLFKRLRWAIGHPSSKTVFAEVPGIVTGLFALRITAADFHCILLGGLAAARAGRHKTSLPVSFWVIPRRFYQRSVVLSLLQSNLVLAQGQ